MNKKFAVACYDNTKGEVIVKVVNGENAPFNSEINLTNAVNIEPAYQPTTLTSTTNKDYNSFDKPKKVSAVLNEYSGFGNSFKMEFQPNSFTILRIKASG